MSGIRQLHLAVNVLGVGVSPAAWQRSSSGPTGALELAHFVRVAKVAERAHFDAFFLADSLAPQFPPQAGIVWGLDPVILVSALASATERIGLVASVSTTFSEPYTLARQFASLAHVSQGRVAWNIVTTYDQPGARKYGLAELPSRDQRYRRAEEFVGVVGELWDSWPADAVVLDREHGIFADLERIGEVHHRGEFYAVDGTLQLPLPRSGRPVLFQAGGSPAGLDLAARHASGVFTAQHTIAGARRFYTDVKSRLTRYGREADSLKILPGVSLVLGCDDVDARRRNKQAAEVLGENESVEAFLSNLGVEISADRFDAAIPDSIREVFARGHHNKGFDQATLDLITENPEITPRQLVAAGANVHRVLVGGPERVAADLVTWFQAGAADGFTLMFDVLPDGIELFAELVVPILVKQGLFRRQYAGATLRDHLTG